MVALHVRKLRKLVLRNIMINKYILTTDLSTLMLIYVGNIFIWSILHR